jgi:hypothetical protein
VRQGSAVTLTSRVSRHDTPNTIGAFRPTLASASSASNWHSGFALLRTAEAELTHASENNLRIFQYKNCRKLATVLTTQLEVLG